MITWIKCRLEWRPAADSEWWVMIMMKICMFDHLDTCTWIKLKGGAKRSRNICWRFGGWKMYEFRISSNNWYYGLSVAVPKYYMFMMASCVEHPFDVLCQSSNLISQLLQWYDDAEWERERERERRTVTETKFNSLHKIVHYLYYYCNTSPIRHWPYAWGCLI